MVSIRDIAKEANVSVSTVSRVLNDSGYVKSSTRQAILNAIKKMNYFPNAIARSMVKQQSHIIGLLVPYFRAPFYAGLVASIEKKAGELGYNIMLCHTNEDAKKERDYLTLLAERRVDGMIILPVSREWNHIYAMKKVVPLVLVSRRSPDGKISCVRADDIQGSMQIVEHLLETGRRKIYYVSGFPYMMNSIDRMEGVRRALSAHKIPTDNLICAEGQMDFSGGYEATKKLLEEHEKPEAIYAINQMMALGAVKAIQERNLKIPDDVALASFAGFDELEYESFIQPRITANVYPSEEIGETAVRLMDECIRAWSDDKKDFQARDIVFSSRLIVRDSTRR